MVLDGHQPCSTSVVSAPQSSAASLCSRFDKLVYCDSESEPGWKAYLVVDEFAAQDSISSTKIRHALRKEAGREVIDGI